MVSTAGAHEPEWVKVYVHHIHECKVYGHDHECNAMQTYVAAVAFQKDLLKQMSWSLHQLCCDSVALSALKTR